MLNQECFLFSISTTVFKTFLHDNFYTYSIFKEYIDGGIPEKSFNIHRQSILLTRISFGEIIFNILERKSRKEFLNSVILTLYQKHIFKNDHDVI